MPKLSIFLLLFLLLTTTSCTPTYKIEGSSAVSSLDGRMLFIKALNNGEWIKIDSAEVIHGKFSMKGVADSITMVCLYMDNESIMPLVIEEGHIQIEISNTVLKAEGTPLNDVLYAFIKKKNAMDLEIGDLERKEARMVMDGVELSNIHAQLQQEGEVLVKKMNDYIQRFITNNFENVLGSNVFLMLCSSLPYPIMTPQIEAILKDAPYFFKSHQLVREFVSKAKENQQLIEERQRLQESLARQ